LARRHHLAGWIYLVCGPQPSDIHEVSSCYLEDLTLSIICRYLTKLCDQLVCLISDEHSANLVWKDDQLNQSDDDEEPESFEAYDRLFTFSVEQTTEEQETAVAKKGFTVGIHMIGSYSS